MGVTRSWSDLDQASYAAGLDCCPYRLLRMPAILAAEGILDLSAAAPVLVLIH